MTAAGRIIRRAVGWLAQTLRLSPGRRRGSWRRYRKFTQRLLQTGARVTAVEPLEAMRAQLLNNVPGVTAIAATAQSMPLADASVDVVVCAQAFHWFATRRRCAKSAACCGRRQARAGRNVRDESHDWVAASPGSSAPTRARPRDFAAAIGVGCSRTSCFRTCRRRSCLISRSAAHTQSFSTVCSR